MNTIRQRVDSLFEDKPTATTDELAEALFITTPHSRARVIRNRLRRNGINVDHVGYQTWVQT